MIRTAADPNAFMPARVLAEATEPKSARLLSSLPVPNNSSRNTAAYVGALTLGKLADQLRDRFDAAQTADAGLATRLRNASFEEATAQLLLRSKVRTSSSTGDRQHMLVERHRLRTDIMGETITSAACSTETGVTALQIHSTAKFTPPQTNRTRHSGRNTWRTPSPQGGSGSGSYTAGHATFKLTRH